MNRQEEKLEYIYLNIAKKQANAPYETVKKYEYFQTPKECYELLREQLELDERKREDIVGLHKHGYDCRPHALDIGAGDGKLADFLSSLGYIVDVIEIIPEFRDQLKTKYNVIGADFLAMKPEDFEPYKIVVMNPPFSNWMKWVVHAVQFTAFPESGWNGYYGLYVLLPKNHDSFLKDIEEEESKLLGQNGKNSKEVKEFQRVFRCQDSMEPMEQCYFTFSNGFKKSDYNVAWFTILGSRKVDIMNTKRAPAIKESDFWPKGLIEQLKVGTAYDDDVE